MKEKKMKTIAKKYRRPENYPTIAASKVNSEM